MTPTPTPEPQLGFSEFHRAIAAFLSEHSGMPAHCFQPDTDFVEERSVDSALFMQLVAKVEELMGSRIESEGFALDRFSTVRKIYDHYYAPSARRGDL